MYLHITLLLIIASSLIHESVLKNGGKLMNLEQDFGELKAARQDFKAIHKLYSCKP